jgi:hypothetical protein
MKQLMAWVYAPLFWTGFIGWGLWLVHLAAPQGLVLAFGAAVAVSFPVRDWPSRQTVIGPPSASIS